MANTYSFGVTTSAGAYGLAQNFQTTRTNEIGEARDANGDVYAVNSYNEIEEFTAEFVFDTDSTLPTIGSNVTIDSNVYMITSVSETESNTEYKRASFAGRRWIANTVPST